MRRAITFILLFMILFSACGAQGEDFLLGVEPEPSEITPAYRSEEEPAQDDTGSYWCTPMNLEDEKAIWKMLTAPITVADIDMNKQTVIYSEPDENSEGIGMVTGQSQGLRVLETLDNGWTKVQTYSTSFHDSKVLNFNAFVTGYILTKKLKTVNVNQNYGIIIDKLTQRLYLFKDGHLETSLAVSTGKYNPDAKKQQPYNETRSGEYLIIYTKTGSLNDEESGMVCSYALKFNAADYIHEVPHRKNADGTKNFRGFEEILGNRASHGCIRVQAKKNTAGYNMSVLANLIKKRKDKNCIKLVIWEDYQGRQVKIPEDDTPLYYNPKGGSLYHSVADCASVKKKFLPLNAFTYGELEEADYSKLKPCPYCMPSPRKEALEEINRIHQESSPGEVMPVYEEKKAKKKK
ncbi:L,D-transpeptidase [Aristaeella lactis]|uniref:L,D-transpeptidase catalytic domain n=1 Tax=Aristaeella lactis TaxID=3046383 RepID=A0AC61PJS4_9FIRM|nr:L,D-transpeptidase [Aristaeella lactis]QUA51686.1 L,D-transpeptidase [Aristaeella lactis]SMC49132.1 L,D-transpeptidase catalytic domain [Aristaeella lactis]